MLTASLLLLQPFNAVIQLGELDQQFALVMFDLGAQEVAKSVIADEDPKRDHYESRNIGQRRCEESRFRDDLIGHDYAKFKTFRIVPVSA